MQIKKMKLRRMVRGMLATVCALSFIAWAQNQPPVVNAGADQSVGTADKTYLEGDVTDDTTPLGSLVIEWTLLSGPTSANILSPATPYSKVTFTEPGVYVFVLTASDGTASSSDTTEITVRQSLPFAMLNPVNNAQIVIGEPYMIRWQMDPSNPCRVSVSFDNGIEFTVLSLDGAVPDSFEWIVDSTYEPGTQGIIRVAEYMNFSNYVDGTFTLANPPAPPSRKDDSGCGKGGVLALFVPCALALNSRRKRRSARGRDR